MTRSRVGVVGCVQPQVGDLLRSIGCEPIIHVRRRLGVSASEARLEGLREAFLPLVSAGSQLPERDDL
jgi:hypothetical protein